MSSHPLYFASTMFKHIGKNRRGCNRDFSFSFLYLGLSVFFKFSTEMDKTKVKYFFASHV